MTKKKEEECDICGRPHSEIIDNFHKFLSIRGRVTLEKYRDKLYRDK